MVGEIKDSVIGTTKEKFTSPILGTYFLSFTFYHWKLIVLMFSSQSVGVEKIKDLEVFWPASFSDFVIPVFITVTFLLLFPLIKFSYNIFLKAVELMQSKIDLYFIKEELRIEELKLKRELQLESTKKRAYKEHEKMEELEEFGSNNANLY